MEARHISPAKKRRTEPDRPIDVNSEEPESPPQPRDPQNLVVSNYLILKKIFSFLNPEDLESCWHATDSESWRDAAESLIFLHYDIEIYNRNWYGADATPIHITKRPLYNRKNQEKIKLNVEDAFKFLDQVLLTQEKLVLSLTVDSLRIVKRDGDEKGGTNFIYKFGHLIEHLEIFGKHRFHHRVFSHFLVWKFPNLRTFHSDSLLLYEEAKNLLINPDLLPQNTHDKLRVISFGWSLEVLAKPWGEFLKIAPNLEAIERLPIWLINAVEIGGKGQVLKSLAYHTDLDEPFARNGVTLDSAFKKLAQLQPKLSSFSFTPSTSCFDQRTSKGLIKPFLFSILKSSAQSLRSFEMTDSTKFDGFQNIPRLEEVKTLVFQTPVARNSCFLPGITLRETFPNVVEISILFCLDKNSIEQYFRGKVESSWGCRVKRLCVSNILHSSALPWLQRMFGGIEDLEFTTSMSEVQEVFPVVVNMWPGLKSMTIVVTGETEGMESRSLDGAFTGLPHQIIAQLLDPSTRGNFTPAQIEGFKSQSTISKLKELRRLTLRIENLYGIGQEQHEQVFIGLTHVTNEFGFQLLPQLKVSVGVYTDDVDIGGIRTLLELLGRNSNTEIVKLYCEKALLYEIEENHMVTCPCPDS